VSLFFTGQGPVGDAIEDGDAPQPGSVVSATAPVSATIGGVAAEVQFAGLAPGFPGVAQINLKIPQLAPGAYPVVVTIAGVASNAAQLAVAGN
jgi:adhesin/invasin